MMMMMVMMMMMLYCFDTYDDADDELTSSHQYDAVFVHVEKLSLA